MKKVICLSLGIILLNITDVHGSSEPPRAPTNHVHRSSDPYLFRLCWLYSNASDFTEGTGMFSEDMKKHIIDDCFNYDCAQGVENFCNGLVSINDDIDIDNILLKTNGYNGSDMSYLLDEVQEISIDRLTKDNNKYICNDDFIKALEKITSSVQPDDIEKIENWREVNG